MHPQILIRQQGYILLPVVLLISLVAAAAFMLNNEAVLQTSVTTSSAEAARADYVVNAGLQHALWQVEQAACGPYTDIASEGFGDHSYSAVITPNNAGGSLSTFTVAVSDDAWIADDTPTQNYGTDTQLTTYFNIFPLVTQRALYRFDIAAAAIPAGAMVVSAVARIFVLDSNELFSVTAHQITADWTEAAVNWDNINTNHDATSVASIPAASPVGQYVEVNITSLAQGWVNGSIANQGIMLKSTFLDDLAQFTSKEYANTSQRPELVIKVSDGSLSNRVDISATGTLSNGITHNKTRLDIPLYQPSSTVVLQPDAIEGKDNWLYEWKSSWNYGADDEVWVENRYANSIANSLFEFELGGVPAGVKILSATLALHQNTPSLNGGTIGVHRMSTPWAEGTRTGGMGASNWSEKDSAVPWATVGGDYDSAVVSSTIVTASVVDWFEWDVRTLVQGWVDGGYENHGLAMVAEVYGTAAHFDSSDHIDATLRPKLTVTYACECGVSCQPPQGSGNVLLVVGDDITLAAADVKKQVLFEDWGYTVNLIDDDANQAAFDTALANNDVAYISETVWGPTLAAKLAVTDKGVVNEEEDQNSYLGLSSSGSNIVGDSMEVIDNSHYITALFANSVLPIFSAPMEGMLVTGTLAPGLQMLGNFSGTTSLAVVDVGGALQSGGTATGRRVAIPIGSSDKFNWDYLNNNGRLIVQRAIQWGTGNTGGFGQPDLLMVVVDPANLTASEIDKKTQVESWGYTVSVIDESDSQSAFDIALAINDVVYISEEALSTKVGTKLTNATIGVVMEEDNLSDEFGLSDGIQWQSGTTLDIVSNGHYITEPFSLGALTVLNTSQAVVDVTGALAPDLQILANSALGPALIAVSQGASIIGGNAAGRRVQLPWGDDNFEINRLTSDGLTIFERALEWASGVGADAISEKIFVSTDSAAVLGGLSFTNLDIVEYDPLTDTASQFFEGSLTALDKSIAALHVLANGHFILSSKGNPDTTLGGITYQAGDLVDYDPAADTATLVFDGSVLFTDPQEKISSVHVLDNGHIILSTSGDAILGGLSFTASDLVDYDPVTDTANLFFDSSATTLSEPITALHVLANGHLILGAKASPDAALGGVTFQVGDLVDYDPVTDSATLFFDGNVLFADPLVGMRSLHVGPGSGVASVGGGGGGGPTGIIFESFTEASDSGTSLIINKPTGTVVDDLLIVAVTTDGDTTSELVAPAGWNVLKITQENGQVTMGVWWKLAGAVESSSYSFTWSGSEQVYGWMMRFTGHDTADPIKADASGNGSSASPQSPAVSTAIDNSLVLRLGGFDDDDITAGNPGLSGHTVINMADSGNGSATVSGGSAYVLQATSGDSGASSFSLTATEEYVSVTLSISPAP